MLVFWKEKLVFLAVPKTGTSAFARALGQHASVVVSDPPELKHAPIYRYNRFFRPMFEKNGAPDMDLLAVVREPISWLGSWYRYRQRAFLDGRPTSTKGLTFDAFVEAYMAPKRPAFAEVGSQAKFLEPRPNGVRATHLFQYEAQPALVAFLEARLGVPIETTRENVSKGAAPALSTELRAQFEAKCAQEFEIWHKAACNGAVPSD